jgi:hypothetical protein
MPTNQLYRRALARCAPSSLLTIAKVVVALAAVYHTFGDWNLFVMLLLLLEPLAWTLVIASPICAKFRREWQM